MRPRHSVDTEGPWSRRRWRLGLRAGDPCAFNASSYLAFRWVVVGGRPWRAGVTAPAPPAAGAPRRTVRSAGEVLAALGAELAATGRGRTGLLLSGGAASGILAALLPPGTPAYTLRFAAQGVEDETPLASRYARRARLVHRVIDVHWSDHLSAMGALMFRKGAPLHPAEVGLHLAACAAKQEGVACLVVGTGAAANLGGRDALLGRDWHFDAFVDRTTFTDPAAVLAEPVSMRPIYEPFRRGQGIDVARFVAEIQGPGLTQAFENALGSGGCQAAAPFETLRREGSGAPADGDDEPSLLREVFARLYPDLELPAPRGGPGPMDPWLADWEGPRREEFRPGLDVARLDGEQRWQVFCLERFLAGRAA